MKTVAEQIAALQEQIDALKEQTPLDAALAAFPAPWMASGDECLASSLEIVCYTSCAVDESGHRPAIATLLAAAPQMLAALMADNASAHETYGVSETTAKNWRSTRAAILAAGGRVS